MGITLGEVPKQPHLSQSLAHVKSLCQEVQRVPLWLYLLTLNRGRAENVTGMNAHAVGNWNDTLVSELDRQIKISLWGLPPL